MVRGETRFTIEIAYLLSCSPLLIPVQLKGPIFLEGDSVRGECEIGLPELYAFKAALFYGAMNLVIGGAVIEAESGVVVIEAVEHCCALVVFQRRSQLAEVFQSALG